MKRVLLFLATNLAILVVLGTVANLLEGLLAAQGIHFQNIELLVFAGRVRHGRQLHLAGALEVDGDPRHRRAGDRRPRNETETWLLQVVGHHAQAAGIGMPAGGDLPVRFAECVRHRRAARQRPWWR